MVATNLSQQQLSYLFLTLLGGGPSADPNNKVEVKVNNDNFDGSIAVPKWVLAQAAGAILGYSSADNNYYFDDDLMPSSIKLDQDWCQIHIDLTGYDQDANKVKVKVQDQEEVRVEGRRKYVNRYGSPTSKTVTRTFRIPRTYDLNKLAARIGANGILHISVPKKNENIIVVSNGDDKYVAVQRYE